MSKKDLEKTKGESIFSPKNLGFDDSSSFPDLKDRIEIMETKNPGFLFLCKN